jgi:Lar family restriction alleviation protein
VVIRTLRPEIRPCPFCGWPGEVQRFEKPFSFEFVVECTAKDCNASIGVRENSAQNAVAQWNSRRRKR